MSDDYAAVITTVILAVLAVGSVQTYTLVRRLRDAMVEWVAEAVDARSRVVVALRAAQPPSPDDLAKVDALTRPDAAVRRLTPAYVASFVWLAVCGVLVYVQIRVLKWAGTHHPEKDPDLAELAFYVCTVAVGVLVIEGVIRGVAGLVGRMRLMRTEITNTRPSDEELAEFNNSLDRYRNERSGEPPADPTQRL
ncbi:hypothetical protein [Streptomyces chartreusis]